MDPVTRAVSLSWEWRWDVILVVGLAVLYTQGWRRLRTRTRPGRRKLAVRWRLVAYWIGLLFVAVALLSPVDTLSNQLFFMHMIQHLLLIMMAPPLLLVANPMPFVLWGLPHRWRLRVGGVIGSALHRKSSFRSSLKLGTAPGIVWLVWVSVLIGWHDPTMYNLALRSDLAHDVEHLSFFLAGMLFWWHVTGAGPRIHKQFGLIGRIAFVLSAIPPNMGLGVVLSFATGPVYGHYTAVPRLWGIGVMVDQQIGGVIMWAPGSMMYLIAALILIAQLLQGENRKPALPENKWGDDEALAAPGIER